MLFEESSGQILKQSLQDHQSLQFRRRKRESGQFKRARLPRVFIAIAIERLVEDHRRVESVLQNGKQAMQGCFWRPDLRRSPIRNPVPPQVRRLAGHHGAAVSAATFDVFPSPSDPLRALAAGPEDGPQKVHGWK